MAETRRPAQFLALLQALDAERVEFIVVGGVAAVLWGAPVSTFDLDIVYALDESNIGRLQRALTALEAVYVDPAGRILRPTVGRLRAGGHHLLRTAHGRLDVLGSIGSGLSYADLIATSELVDVRGLQVHALRLETLIATKEQTNRPKDRAVLALLRQTLAEQGDAETP